MRVHLSPLSFNLSNLERSIQVTQLGFQWPISLNLFKITRKLVLMMDRKSYMKFHLAPLFFTWSNLERSNRGQAYFRGP